jgi:hypothetical protein
MTAPENGERQEYITQALDTATAQLQIALIYQDELEDLDYSREIERIDSICRAFYLDGRDALEEIEDSFTYADTEFNNIDNEVEQLCINKGDQEWILMQDAGAASEPLQAHNQNLHRDDTGLQAVETGSRLRNALETYEEVIEAARDDEAYDAVVIEDRILDRDDGGTELEGEDAELW